MNIHPLLRPRHPLIQALIDIAAIVALLVLGSSFVAAAILFGASYLP